MHVGLPFQKWQHFPQSDLEKYMTKLVFGLQPSNAELQLMNSPLKMWTDLSASEHLNSGGGNINDMVEGKLICHSEGVPVVTLEASWQVKMPKTGVLTGRATCDLCSGTSFEQTWTLKSRTE